MTPSMMSMIGSVEPAAVHSSEAEETARLQRLETSYKALLAVSLVLNSQRDSENLFRAITEQLSAVVPWARAGVTLYDPEQDAFRFYAMETQLARIVVEPHTVIPRPNSAVGWVYEHKRPHVRPDLQRERIFLEDEWYAEEGLGRMINLPLLVKDGCLGTLNIGSEETGLPASEDLEFLSQVAMQIASAIAQVRAYEEIRRLRDQLARENEYLIEELKLSQHQTMVGGSGPFIHVVQLAREVAQTNAIVLITGETGTGKELLAQAIHEWSPRRQKPMIRVNCAALPAGLVESELFGHERGAFTGADQRRPGRFELAHQGTLFLDEVGELPVEAQAKLLRVLQDGVVDRVGGVQPLRVDVRVIAATNVDLAEAVRAGKFRSDLYYRLAVFPIVIPPLRERPDDVALLARHFLAHYAHKFGRACTEIDGDSLRRLISYHWPGNVRELENVIERALILSKSSVLRIDPALITPPAPPADPSASQQLIDVERRHILQTLTETRWRIEGVGGAAARLGLPPSTLRSRMRKLGVVRPPLTP